ncbi:MAG: hypothetical protein KDD06_08830 [Phaeodactylibacter sp.]|nr:hypothetical protein [Phaeodactylibacter sp.]MCB9266555.1 hypothetical protein [Lewinellaceae bacterium]MCB9288037.1 hypothetical protein [Lewinellaceae bacterium]
MAVLKFFKLPKHQQYQYKPRFWDPKKEELEERLKQIDAMKQGDAEAIKARLSANFRKGYSKDTSFRKRQVMRSNIILLGVLAMLVILSYLFITVYLPKIASSVGSGGAQF